jgi:hypothetical protein
MLSYLKESGIENEKITFVYGDTHEGGWGHDWKAPTGEIIRIYNTGAWVVDETDQHPPCHIFAVDEKGREYMLDVSYDSEIVGEEKLVSMAGEEVTLANDRAGMVLRPLGVLIELFKKATD